MFQDSGSASLGIFCKETSTKHGPFCQQESDPRNPPAIPIYPSGCHSGLSIMTRNSHVATLGGPDMCVFARSLAFASQIPQ